ncbi:MAG: alpha/beta hydrolase, partial [Dehalococcoidia bacterium]
MLTDVSVDAGHYQVRVWSKGQGEPLLYLHGVDGLPDGAPFLNRLAQRRHVYAPEHPGFGRSTGIDRIDDVLDMTLYYRDLIEALGLGSVSVIGHSLGGMFAAELAAICPQVVSRLILVDAFGLWIDEQPIPDFFAMGGRSLRARLWHDPESPLAQAAPAPAANGGSALDQAVTRAGNLGTSGKFLWPLPDRGLRKRLGRISADTLLVWGESDKLIHPDYAAAFQTAIANSRLVLIPAAGHSPML